MNSALQGKEIEYLYGLQKMAGSYPQEATLLLQRVFDKGDLKIRLTALRTLIFSETMGDGKLLGELFVKLMGAVTNEERREIVEPFLESLLNRSEPITANAQQKRNWLYALVHGWKEEITSISTATPLGRAATPTVERAGLWEPKNRA